MIGQRTNAHEFFDIHVMPTYEDWSKDPINIRLAMSAAVVLNHMADYVWHTYKALDPVRIFNTKTCGDFRAELAIRNPHFAIIRDVAEAHKHLMLDRNSRVLTSTEQTSVGTTNWGNTGFGTGPFGGGPSIIVKLDDETKYHFAYLADEVRRIWVSMIA